MKTCDGNLVASKRFISVVVLAFAFVLSSCFKPHTRDAAENAKNACKATFDIDELRGHSEISHLMDSFSIPVSRIYNFSTCVRDIYLQETIKKGLFEISGGDHIESVRSDTKGCLYWSEQIAFAFFSKEKYLTLHRKLTAKDIHTGSINLEIGINPWNFSNKAADVVDLTRAQLPEEFLAKEADVRSLLSGEAPQSLGQPGLLWPQALSGESVSSDRTSEGGMNRKLVLRISPGLLLRDLQNLQAIYPLTQANLKLSATLIASSSSAGLDRNYVVWQSPMPVDLVREGNLYKATLDMHIDYAAATSAMLLAIKLVPNQGPPAIVPFEALYKMASLTNLLNNGDAGLNLSTNNGSGFSYEEYIAKIHPVESAMEGATGTSAEPANQNPVSAAQTALLQGHAPNTSISVPNSTALPSGITKLDLFQPTFLQVDVTGTVSKTTTTRTMGYMVTVCFNDIANGNKPAIDTDFTVKKASGGTEAVRTKNIRDKAGCIRWEDTLTHALYDSDHYMLFPVTITHASGYKLVRSIGCNPWENNVGVCRDTMEDPEFMQKVNNRQPVQSRLLAQNFAFDTVDTRGYEVDRFLSLKINKRFRLRVSFRVQRLSATGTGVQTPSLPLNDGVYLLRAVIDARVNDTSGEIVELITAMKGKERLVRVRDGAMIQDIDFAIADPRLMRARTNLVFELLPLHESKLTPEELQTLNSSRAHLSELIDHSSGLQTPTFAGPLYVRDETGSASVLPTDDLLADPTGLSAAQNGAAANQARPLARATVPALWEKMVENDKRYFDKASAESHLKAQLFDGNLEYVPLSHASEILAGEPELSSNNHAFPVASAAQQVLDIINQNYGPEQQSFGSGIKRFFEQSWRTPKLAGPLNAQSLFDLIEGRRQLEPALVARLCYVLASELPKRMSRERPLFVNESDYGALAYLCTREMTSFTMPSLIIAERRLRIFEIENPVFSSGRSLELSVNSDVSFGRNQTANQGWTFSWSPTSIAEGILRPLKFLNILSMTGLSYTYSSNRSTGTSVQEGTAFASGTRINMEQIDMKMTVKSSEPCMALRLNPKLFIDNAHAFRSANPALSAEERALLLSRGLMICAGMVSKTPIPVTERYYSLAQPALDETTLDRGNITNQPWLLSLRGTADFARVITLLSAKKADPRDVRESIDPGTLPLERLKAAYGGFLPTAPAVITLDP